MTRFISSDYIFLVFGHFRLYVGIFQFLRVGPVYWVQQKPHIYNISLIWPHLPVSLRLPDWEGSAIIIIGLPMPWVCLLCQHVCQHARSVPVCQMVIPEVSELTEVPEGPRCPEGQDVVPLCQMAQNPKDCTYDILLAWNDDLWIVFPLMWWPIGCVYCQSKCV